MKNMLEPLTKALCKKLSKTIINASYQLKEMQAGSVGEVRLITGMAETDTNEKIPYKIVLKTQKQWDRQGDKDSWRREYDLYSSDLDDLFMDAIRRPARYHAEIDCFETRLWMEYIEGASAMEFTCEMYERVSMALGRFQGKLYSKPSIPLQRLSNLSKTDAFEKAYLYFKSLNGVYDYIRSADCELPRHLREMLIEIDNTADDLWKRIQKLPVVFCHRDPFVWNAFVTNDVVTYIDWDSAGWGYMGEDIVNLLADSADIENLVKNYRQCVPAYCHGFAQYADISHVSSLYIIERIIMHFGYRLVEGYMLAQSSDEKKCNLDTLQRFCEIYKH